MLSAAFVYQLPFGEGKKWANTGGVVNALVGGWQMSTIFRYSSGLPLYFRSSFCNVPGQFRAGCIPAIINPSAVFAQDKGDYDPARGPLFNAAAFEPVDAFNYYYGRGNRVEETVRGFGFHNQDLVVHQEHQAAGQHQRPVPARSVQRVELAHLLEPRRMGRPRVHQRHRQPGLRPWNGSVSDPRSIQLALRFEF